MPKFNNGESAASVRQKINDAIDKVDGVQAISDADITGGTIDNTVIGGVTPAAGSFTNLTANTDLTINSTTTVTAILDEDNMASDSATALATQQSIKAYVDSQVTAQDLDFAGDTGTGAIDLDSQVFTVAGTANQITTVASGQNITISLPATISTTTADLTNVEVTNIKAKDGTAAATIADVTGVVTIPSAVLTTADINGGTIDGAIIGGTTPAAGTFSTATVNGNITVTGTVDGRDIAADGTKLDTVETNADVTDTANVTAAGALMDSELTNEAAVKALDQGVSTTDSPSFAGLTATTADINGGTIDGTVIGGSTPAAISGTTGQFGTSLNVAGTITADGLTVDGQTQLTRPSTEGLTLTLDSASNSNRSLTFTSFTNSVAGAGWGINAESSAGVIKLQTASVDRLKADSNGDISFYEDTGTTPKFFWDASAESLGIGTSSPEANAKLDVAGNLLVDAYNNGGEGYGLFFRKGFISTAQPSITLKDHSGSFADGLSINSADGITFRVNNADRVLFNNNGYVLVGTTDTFPADDTNGNGIVLRGSLGDIVAQASSRAVVDLNRTTSDGVIANFRRDGSTVGSIGANSGRLYLKDDTYGGLAFKSTGSAILPTDGTGALADDVVDIGDSSTRWQDLYLSGAANAAGFQSNQSTTGFGYVNFGDTDDSNIGQIGYDHSSNYMRFQVNNAERMRIDSSGNVGIGTTDPKTRLQSSGAGTLNAPSLGSSSTNAPLYLTNNDTAYGLVVGNNSADGHVWLQAQRTDGTATAYNITLNEAGGNVGIGTTSPATILQTNVASGSNEFRQSVNGVARGQLVATDTEMYLANLGSGNLRITVGGSERMRITSGGNVGIGTTLPNAILETGITSLGDTRTKLRVTGYRNDSFYGVGAKFQAGNDSTAQAIVFLNSSGTEVGSIRTEASSTAYNTSSDYRLKENVTTLDGAAYRLEQIPVHRFNFIADPDTTVDGFLAHEVQEIVPEAVTGEKDAVDADGNPVYQGIDQSKLVPLLTAALQEALQKIDALEARVATLEAN